MKDINDMEKIFDSHAHYTDKRFRSQYPGGTAALLSEIMPAQVGWILNVATNLEDAVQVVKQAREYAGMYAAVGIHPGDIKRGGALSADMSRLREMLAGAKDKKIVAVGEIGLDYYWQPYDRAAQHEYFEAQMIVAREFGLPVIIHDREAHGDCLDMIEKFPGVRGVFHSFSGSAEMALELAGMGWYISFSGVITFKNARKAVEAAAVLPIEKILIETDCPYLSPYPHRGELNHSGLLGFVAERLGEIKKMSADEVILRTRENAARLFSIKLV